MPPVDSVDAKIVSSDEIHKLCQEYRDRGLKVVLCHGVFDLLHPGHITHLQQARNLGDILVVSVTAAEYVSKGPGRPFFNDMLRLQSLASLSCVDHVILSRAETALDVLDCLQPDIYVNGAEYEAAENDLTRNIERESAKVRSYGGKVCFTGGPVFSSTKLLNQEFPVVSGDAKDFLADFASRCSVEDIQAYLLPAQDLRVLVVGDLILDQYVFCAVQGLSLKDRALSALFEHEETYPGGALAIARHISRYCREVCLCSIVGDGQWRQRQRSILNSLKSEFRMDLQEVRGFQTAIKQRYVERKGLRNEFDKLFAMNYLDRSGTNDEGDRQPFYDRLESSVSNYDLVVVCDFGHGLVDEQVMEILQDRASYLAVNCQTNTANFGNNLINKYRRADTFTIDERELKLAFSGSRADPEELLCRLAGQLKAGMGWLTLGSRGVSGVGEDGKQVNIPALTLITTDTVGAGDAFFAIASLCARAQVPLEPACFLANVAGALAANILGNAKPVERAKLLKFASTLLNY